MLVKTLGEIGEHRMLLIRCHALDDQLFGR